MSNVQFNLLPASKTKAIAAQAGQQQLTGRVLNYAIASVILFVALVGFNEGWQGTQADSSSKDVAAKVAQLKKTPNLQKILTVQNQLQTAANLHASQHDTSRIFGYLAKLVPAKASVSLVSIDLVANTIKINGAANTASTVNTFIDSLKYAQYQVGSASPATAFSGVVEDSFAIAQQNVQYSLSASFAPQLFANNLTGENGQILIPNLIVSTSGRANAGALFGGGN